jgi:hypothetical protein
VLGEDLLADRQAVGPRVRDHALAARELGQRVGAARAERRDGLLDALPRMGVGLLLAHRRPPEPADRDPLAAGERLAMRRFDQYCG